MAREGLKYFGLTTGAILGLFYIQNLYDNLGDFLSHGAGVTEILHYSLLLTPSLLSPVLP
ncbi:MAG: LptF/LptG family permease, partial [Polaribacter sp.]|nr:LptF/LptG family permease [Polaribacter sp.]